jgi:hypothetical protein
MNPVGEFRLCAGCREWALWTPQRERGPVYCCEACALGHRCACARDPSEEASAARGRVADHPGG